MPHRPRTIVVPHADLVGRTVALRVVRFVAAGAFLAAPDATDAATPAGETPADATRPASVSSAAADETILLPKREVPAGTTVGDTLTVFVGLDSADRPIATTRTPALQLGEVAFLRVTAVTPVGAFVDWGLPKELLVPFREQTRDLRVGDRHPVGLFVDKTGRLAGTMRVSEFLRTVPIVREGEWVAGEAWRVDPAVGLFVIVERRFVGLVPKSEPSGIERGEAAMFRVTRVRSDGRFELSLRAAAHEEIADDAAHVLAILQAPGAAPVSDHSSPDEIRARFGLSKKAFKRAVGRLLKERKVVLDGTGAVTPARDEGQPATGAATPSASPAARSGQAAPPRAGAASPAQSAPTPSRGDAAPRTQTMSTPTHTRNTPPAHSGPTPSRTGATSRTPAAPTPSRGDATPPMRAAPGPSRGAPAPHGAKGRRPDRRKPAPPGRRDRRR